MGCISQMLNKNVSRKPDKRIIILFYLIAALIISVSGYLTNNISNEQRWFSLFSVLILLTALLQFITLRKYVKLISVTSIFFILAYCFHFGIIINKGIFTYYIPSDDIYYRYGMDFYYFKKAAQFCLVCILFLGLGVLCAAKPKVKDMYAELPKLHKSAKIFGWVLVVIGAPFLIALLVQAIKVFTNGVYEDSFDAVGDGSGITSFFSNFAYAGVACLITYYSREKNSKVKAKLLWLVAAVILFANIMFTGGRGTKLLMFIALSLVAYYNKLFELSLGRVIFLIVLGYLAIVTLNTIADVRSVGMAQFFSVFMKNLQGRSLLELIQETGGTIYTPYLCFVQKGSVYNTAFGGTYLASLIAILPNINGVFTNIINNASFVKSLEGSALGGSFIGEAYFNFGYFGIFVMIIIGIFICKSDEAFRNSLFNGKVTTLALLLPVVCSIMWWTRDASTAFVRLFIWGYIIIFVIWRIVASLRISRENKQLIKNIREN